MNEEREQWDRKKASIQEGFMKELDEEGSSAKDTAKAPVTGSTASSTANNTAAVTPAASVSGKSDDDAVLVDSPAPSATGSPAGKKKKKGKK